MANIYATVVDNFEHNDLFNNGWVDIDATGTRETQSGTKYEGTYAYHGASNSKIGLDFYSYQLDMNYCFYVYTDAEGNGGAIWGLMDASRNYLTTVRPQGTPVKYQIYNGTAYVQLDTPAGVGSGVDSRTDDWYKWCFSNNTDNTGDVYLYDLNGDLMGWKHVVPASTNDINSILIYSGSLSGNTYVDYIHDENNGETYTANYTTSGTQHIDTENAILTVSRTFTNTSQCSTADCNYYWYEDSVIFSTDTNSATNFTSTGDYNITLINETPDGNYQIDTTITIGEYPQGFTCTITNQTYYIGEKLEINYNTTNDANYSIWLYSTDDNTTRTNYDTNEYTLKNIDFLDYFDFNCHATNNLDLNKTTTGTFTNTIDKNLTIFIKDEFSKALITPYDLNYNTEDANYEYLSQTSYSWNLTNILQKTNKQKDLNIIIIDPNLEYADYDQNYVFDENTADFNIEMSPNKLILSFTQLTQGLIITQTWAEDFNAKDLIIVQKDLAIGKVKITFNNNNQTFEYYNDQETYIDENVYILDSTDGSITTTITNIAGNPIEDALVKYYIPDTNVNSGDINTYIGNWRQIGQQLTNSQGQITIKTKNNDPLRIIVQKTGYEEKEKRIIGEEYIGSELTITIDSGAFNLSENAFVFTTHSKYLLTIPSTIYVYHKSISTKTVCYKLDINGINEEEECKRGTATTYTLYATSRTGTYDLNITIDGELFAQYSWTYANQETSSVIFRTETPEKQQFQYTILIFMVFIIAIAVGHILGKGLDALVVMIIMFSVINTFFLIPAIAGIFYLLAVFTQAYRRGN